MLSTGKCAKEWKIIATFVVLTVCFIAFLVFTVLRSLLGKRAAQIDQIRRQMQTKALLQIWLYVHVPLTIALLAALTAHVVSVFYYW